MLRTGSLRRTKRGYLGVLPSFPSLNIYVFTQIGYLESMLLPSYFPAVLPAVGAVVFSSRPPGPPRPCWVVSRDHHLLTLLLKEWHLGSKPSPLKYKVHALYSRKCVSSPYPEITHFVQSSCKLGHLVSQCRMNYRTFEAEMRNQFREQLKSRHGCSSQHASKSLALFGL